MRFITGIQALVALGSLVSARDPCGEIDAIYKSQLSDQRKDNITSEDMTFEYPAKTAAACLRAVPFDSALALYTTEQIRLFTQLYSAQAWFYDPPPSKLQVKAVNLNETFDEIEKRAAKKDGYSNQFDFQYDLIKLYGSIKDGHVSYIPNCAAAFGFKHNGTLVMVKEDDEDYPSIHHVEYTTGEIGKRVTKINNEDAFEYLDHLALTLPGGSWIDQDARFNQLFAEIIEGSRMVRGLFAYRMFLPESLEDIKLTYADGTSSYAVWTADYQVGKHIHFANVTQFYEQVCLDEEWADVMENGRTPKSPEEHGTQTASGPGKPDFHIFDKRHETGPTLEARDNHNAKPVLKHQNLMELHVVGEKKDVAVLKIWGFYPQAVIAKPSAETADAEVKAWWKFLQQVEEYLKKKEKVNKLIIDLRNNGGGMVHLGFLTVHWLFPSAHPYYSQDHRRSPLMDLFFEKGADFNDSFFDYKSYRKPDNSEYASVEEYMGPVYKYGDYFTSQSRFDIDDVFNKEYPYVTQDLKRTTPLLDINNIIIFSDGKCGSTCAIVTEAVTSEGVKAVTTGGVPDHKYKKWMQPVGGVKGSQVIQWDAMQQVIENTIPDPDSYAFIPKRLPFIHQQTQVNLKNSYEPGSDIPIEFIYQPGNAHVWMTEEHWYSATKFWEAVAAAAWDASGSNVLPEIEGGIHGPHDDHGGVNRNHLSPNKADINSWGYAITQQFENYGWSFHV